MIVDRGIPRFFCVFETVFVESERFESESYKQYFPLWSMIFAGYMIYSKRIRETFKE